MLGEDEQEGGSLTVAEGLEKIAQLKAQRGQDGLDGYTGLDDRSEADSRSEVDGQRRPDGQQGLKRKRAPPKCSICRSSDHNARICKSR